MARAKRLPPDYQFFLSTSEQVSHKTSCRVVLELRADDGTPVLKGTVLGVGQYDAVEVIDHCLRETIGDILHADTYSMVDAAWIHYKLRVNWWHRNVTQYATTWAAMIALLLGLLSIFVTLW